MAGASLAMTWSIGRKMTARRRYWLFILGMALLGAFVAVMVLKGGPVPAVEWAFAGLVEFFAIIVRGLGG